MRYLIGLIIYCLPMIAFSANTVDGIQSITERKIIAQQQVSSFTQKIKDKSVSGVGRYYIGADASCDFSNILQGINATIGDMNAPELLIASNKTYDENLVLQNINMFMDGSYSNCSDARNGIHGGNGANITGATGSTSPIILILGNAFGYQISLQNFRLNNSNGIGIRTISSSSTISIDNIGFLRLNNGAISVEGNTSLRTTLLIDNSFFILNSSNNGGAIKCSGTNNLVALENTVLSANSSTGDGGAVFLDQACDFSMTGSGFVSNTTDGRGGAIYAEFGSDIILDKVSLSSNTAQSDGGAIYVTDGATTVNATSTRFSDNTSNGSGGAISLHNGASFTLKQTSLDCIDSSRCNFFDDNQSTILGGAIANIGGDVEISSTYFEDNRSNFGTAIYSSGASSSTRIEGSVFNHNGDNGLAGMTDTYVVRAISDAHIDVLYSTFADNNADTATFGATLNSSMTIESTIIHDASSGNVFDIVPGSVVDHDCLLVHEVISVPIIQGASTIAGNPRFIDPAKRDYHLSDDSPAIDSCGITTTINMFDTDIDFQIRGIAFPGHQNLNRFFDIGADEAYLEVIFTDSFE